MIIYICGPITGNDFDVTLKKFNMAENYLMEKYINAVILNPIKTPAGLTQESYMDISFAQIRACQCLYVLKGFENSDGCLAEIAYAKKIARAISYQK